MHKCEKCEKSFDTNEALLKHSPLCSGPQTCWSCHICGATFYRRHGVIGHKRIHNGKKQTRIRKKSTSERYTFREKRSILHDCQYCGKIFESGPLLGSHTRMCAKNPKYEERIAMISEMLSKKNS